MDYQTGDKLESQFQATKELKDIIDKASNYIYNFPTT